MHAVWHSNECIDAVVSDVDSDHKVGRHEFDDFVFHMAAADLAHGGKPQQKVCLLQYLYSRMDCS